MAYAETLRTVGMFASLTDEELGQIGELLEAKKFAKGNTIFHQGEVGDALYIVESGRSKASTRDPAGREKVLALYGPGDFFGEMALVSGQTRSATLSAVTECTLLVLRKQSFESFLATNLQVMRQMLAVIAQRQAQTNVLLSQAKASEEEAKVSGKVITVFSPKGGVGRTTVAVNLATALRLETGRPVALIDCSLLFGDVGVMMNLEPQKSIADLLPHINELEAEILNNIMATHQSGVKVLLAPPSPEVAELITGDHMKLLLSKLRELFDYIVIDTLPYLHEVTLGVLDSADQVLVVTTLEMPALKNVRVFMEVTRVLGYPPGKIMLVINRSDSTGGIRLQDVEAMVGQKFAASIISDGRLAIQASNRGVPLILAHKDAQISQDLAALARLVRVDESQLAPQVDEPQVKRRFDLKRLVARLRTPRKMNGPVVRRGAAAPRLGDLLTGLGGTLVGTVGLLFLVSLASRIAEGSIPVNALVNLCLYVSVFVGALLTVRYRSRSGRGGAPLGLAIGAAFGTVVVLANVAMFLAHLTAGQPGFGLVIIIPGYGLLGFAGGIVAELRRPALRPLSSVVPASGR